MIVYMSLLFFRGLLDALHDAWDNALIQLAVHHVVDASVRLWIKETRDKRKKIQDPKANAVK